jgi:MYXO-CTERM domain-containing protein
VPRRMSRLVITAATVGVSMLVATPAWAHVTVHTDNATRGASDVAVMFRVPNEEDNAATVKVQVIFPTTTPLLDVLVEPHAGWTATTKTSTLAHPVTTDDGSITSVISQVTWVADNEASGGLQPGQADDFTVICGQLPRASTVTFPTLQTYSNGDVVRWIETQAPGADEPDHPAPVLALAARSQQGGSTVSSTGQDMTMAPQPSTSATTVTADAVTSDDGDSHGLAIAALVVALLALAAALISRRRKS